jgi:alanine racemase
MPKSSKITAQWIASILDATVFLDRPDDSISYFLTDSRKYTPPQESLFLALRGAGRDGHEYIQDLVDRGYTNFLVEHWEGPVIGFNVIVVEDVWAALHELARVRRNGMNGQVLGIAGSLGKTTVKEWAFEILNGHFSVERSPGSYNSQLGVPLSVLGADPEKELHLFEAGISEKGEMDSLARILRPDLGIMCAIGSPHDAGFRDRKEKIIEKLKLFESVKKLIIRCDDPQLLKLARTHVGARKLICWSFTDEASDYQVDWLEDGRKLKVIRGLDEETFIIPAALNNEVDVTNICYALILGMEIGLNGTQLQSRLLQLNPLQLRRKFVEGRNGCRIISDVYSADLDSLRSSIDLLYQVSGFERRSIVLSSLKETGRETDSWVREIAAILSERPLSRIYLIGAEFERKRKLFPDATMFMQDTSELLEYFSRHTPEEELILLKGARVFRFERIEKYLKLKDHPANLEIDLSKVRNNLQLYRSLIGKDVRIMAMVKAFSYGTGLTEIADLLDESGVDYLAVAYPDEGKEIRSRGIDVPIMVLHPEIESFEKLIYNRLEPEIFSMRMLRAFIEACEDEGELEYPIHLKLDTGMHRLGFEAAEMEELIEVLGNTEAVYVQSIFSHLASSEDPEQEEFSRQQISLFEDMLDRLRQEVAPEALAHIVNSAGISRYPDAQYDMVRLGIGLYGVDPSDELKDKLELCARLSASISQIRTIQKGEGVGYGRAWIAERTTRIATIPLGYADGLSRNLSNGHGTVYIRGKACPIVGNVCMDLCMVDLTDVEAEEGEEVVIFESAEQLSLFSEKSQTIPYEVLTSISKRIHRTYLSS